ncbi:hypothetical protein [Scytonema sp. NUACC21]
MLRISGAYRRLRQSVLLVMLSFLVWAICLLVAWVHFLPNSEYEVTRQSLDEQSISSINPVVGRATNELAEYIQLSTNLVSNTIQDLIDQESAKAEAQFKHIVGPNALPAPGLRDAIKITLVQNLCKELRE